MAFFTIGLWALFGATTWGGVEDQVLREDVVETLTGSFAYSSKHSELDAIEQQIETAVAKINFFIRPIARKRLRMLTKPAATFTFAAIAGGLRVTNPLVVRDCLLDGKPSDFRDRRGKQRKSICEEEARGIRETFLGLESGSWTHSFQLSEDGQTLMQSVSIRSPQLGAPISYSVTYQKLGRQIAIEPK